MQHYAIFLRAFNFDIEYRRSEQNSNADLLSRLPIPDREDDNNTDVVDVFYADVINSLPLTSEDIKYETVNDSELSRVIVILNGKKQITAKDTWNVESCDFSIENGALVRKHQIVIPSSVRKTVLKELHLGHFGIVTMKNLARSHCCWPNINHDIENLVSKCEKCQLQRNEIKNTETHVWETPRKPFERVHIDFAGKYLGKYFIILVDALSKWPEVYIVPNMLSETTIDVCTEIFARYAIYLKYLFRITKPLLLQNFSKIFSQLTEFYIKRSRLTNPRLMVKLNELFKQSNKHSQKSQTTVMSS